ncbi:hypothetical protein EGR_08155 [Echinococcus granulosus]|uniref:Uncharacterized protein n=1 Tax=Echinococcus granulosus TaxID=6210 RepID=W6UUE8_ECHGR|nr:hypothetical protein EGR_08155 [Echinococcus granulosus]EUB57004.1 hypothetical protein EGR_08155 [Echinococcus granulosus]
MAPNHELLLFSNEFMRYCMNNLPLHYAIYLKYRTMYFVITRSLSLKRSPKYKIPINCLSERCKTLGRPNLRWIPNTFLQQSPRAIKIQEISGINYYAGERVIDTVNGFSCESSLEFNTRECTVNSQSTNLPNSHEMFSDSPMRSDGNESHFQNMHHHLLCPPYIDCVKPVEYKSTIKYKFKGGLQHHKNFQENPRISENND